MSWFKTIENTFQKNKSITIFLTILFIILFRKYFIYGQIPIPGDILIGAYYPWLDNKWGYPVSVPVLNNLPSDVISIIYPFRIMGINLLKQGLLPLWDTSILMGVPLLANFQSALLNPLNILFFILPNMAAWSIQVMLQVFLALVLMFIFLRDLGLNKYAATLGSVFYALSGYFLVWLEYNTLSYTVALFPLILYLVSKISKTPRLNLAFLLSLTICFSLFCGYPLNSFISIGFGILYFLYLSILTREKVLVKSLLVFGGILGGLLMAFVQLLPGFEAGNLSVRIYDNTALAGGIKYLSIEKFITFFVPDFYGNPGTMNYWGNGSYDNFAFFIPAIGVYFLIIALVSLKAFQKKYLIFVIFIILAFIVATNNPIINYLENIQIFDLKSSVNTRVLFVVCFSASVLAALGTSIDFKNNEWRDRLIISIVPIIVFGIIVSAVLTTLARDRIAINSVEDVINVAKNFSERVGYLSEYINLLISTSSNLAVAIRNTAIPSLVMLLGMIAFLITSKKLRFFVILLALFISSKSFIDKYISFSPAEQIYPQEITMNVLLELSDSHRFQAEDAELIPQNTWSVYNLASPSGQNVLTPLSTARYLNLINNGSTNDLTLTRFNLIRNLNSPLINTLDVEHYIALNRHEIDSTPHPDGKPFPWKIPDSYEDIHTQGTVRIYKNTNNLGPAWFSKNVECTADFGYIEKQIVSEHYSASDKTYVDCKSGNLENSHQGTVNLISNIGGKKVFEVSTPTNNYLNISSAYYPGWKAKLDDKDTQVLTSNNALQAVYIPKGNHKLVLSYEPESFKRGLAISVVTLLLWIVVLVFHKTYTIRTRRIK